MIENINLDKVLYQQLIDNCDSEEQAYGYFRREIYRWAYWDKYKVLDEEETYTLYNTCLSAISKIHMRNVAEDNMTRFSKKRIINNYSERFLDGILKDMKIIYPECKLANRKTFKTRSQQLRSFVNTNKTFITDKILNVV